jgi:beta-phosphoglucomutase-like phosphatase (HAD superfamily)
MQRSLWLQEALAGSGGASGRNGGFVRSWWHVAIEDVESAKPAPDAYLRALELLGCERAEDVVAFEDTDVGIAAARAAGVRCIAVAGTLRRDRLAAADEVVPGLDVPLLQRLLG